MPGGVLPLPQLGAFAAGFMAAAPPAALRPACFAVSPPAALSCPLSHAAWRRCAAGRKFLPLLLRLNRAVLIWRLCSVSRPAGT